MNEETYLKIKDALVSESDKINHFTMLGFALFSVLAIRGSSIVLNIWAFLAIMSWGVSVYWHYVHSMTGRDSIYLTTSTKKGCRRNEIEQLRDKNIKDLKCECSCQYGFTLAGFMSFAMGCKDYLNIMGIIKNSQSCETLIALIFMAILIFFALWTFLHAAGIGHKALKIINALCLLSLAVLFALYACEQCKASIETLGSIVLWVIPLASLLCAIKILIGLYCQFK